MTVITLLRLPPDAPAAQGQPDQWRATLTVGGSLVAEATGGRELCLAAIGLKPPPQPRGAWVDRGVPVFMFTGPTPAERT